MDLLIVQGDGRVIVEGTPDAPFMSRPDDLNRLLEVCFAHRSHLALLYAGNLPAAFFDLSSGEAGTVLQKLRNYGSAWRSCARRIRWRSAAGSARWSPTSGGMMTSACSSLAV